MNSFNKKSMTIKILFVNPSLRLGSATKYLPVGIASVMTYLEQHNFTFDLLDIDIDDLTNEEVMEYIRTHRYDVILTGSIVTHYKWMKWFVNSVKNLYPNTKVVVGNSVAGSIPEVFLRNSGADIAVIGEGEVTCLEVVRAIRDGNDLSEIEGIAFLDPHNNFIKTPKRKALSKLDDFPMIKWDYFDVEKYFTKSFSNADGLVFKEGEIPRTMPVVSARGCVFRCTFCHFVFWDDPYRYRSARNIMDEIRRNIDLYGVNFINFWDDLSFSSLKQVERLVDEVLKSGLKFYWNAAIRTDLFGNPKFSYEERLRIAMKMKDSGCVNVGYSLESGNQQILEMMNKKVKVEYFVEQAEILERAGITSSVSVVFGYPPETEESIKETFELCLNVGIYPSIGYLLPLPSTGMYEYAKQNGFIKDEDEYLDAITERQDFNLNLTKLPQDKIESLIKKYAAELNSKLDLGLKDGSLIKTGGYMYQKSQSKDNPRPEPKPQINPDSIERIENDFSFNYSQAVFKIHPAKPG
jgi:radical SAM superfamily enzyme YgiQ (UPF0313 family)